MIKTRQYCKATLHESLTERVACLQCEGGQQNCAVSLRSCSLGRGGGRSRWRHPVVKSRSTLGLLNPFLATFARRFSACAPLSATMSALRGSPAPVAAAVLSWILLGVLTAAVEAQTESPPQLCKSNALTQQKDWAAPLCLVSPAAAESGGSHMTEVGFTVIICTLMNISWQWTTAVIADCFLLHHLNLR